MRSDYSRTLAFFNLAQEILSRAEEIGEDVAIDSNIVNSCMEKCIGRSMRETEFEQLAIVVCVGIAECSQKSCEVFDFAHALYHVCED